MKGQCRWKTRTDCQDYCVLNYQLLAGGTCEGCPDYEEQED